MPLVQMQFIQIIDLASCNRRQVAYRQVAVTAFILASLPCWFVGCRQSDEVRVQSVPKQPATPAETAPATPPLAETQPLEARMMAAIVRGGDQDWFFKLLGEPAQVGQSADKFKELLSSLKINEQGKPAWDLPDGWTQLPAGGIRLATIHVTDDPHSPSISVVGLAAGQDTLDNVNRWRNQLQLEPLTAAELAESVEKIDVAGELQVELYDLAGNVDTENPMVGPFASAAGMPNPHNRRRSGINGRVIVRRWPAS